MKPLPIQQQEGEFLSTVADRTGEGEAIMEIKKSGDDINSKSVTNSKSVIDKEMEFETICAKTREAKLVILSINFRKIIATIIYSLNHVPKINAKVIYSFHNSQLLTRK